MVLKSSQISALISIDFPTQFNMEYNKDKTLLLYIKIQKNNVTSIYFFHVLVNTKRYFSFTSNHASFTL